MDAAVPIGGTLAAARAARGLALSDAEALTCLRARYLSALETDDFAKLPGHAYARAFLRTYATALGLDADRLVAEFEAQDPEPPEPLTPKPAPAFRRRSWKPAHVLAWTLVGAALAWTVWTSAGGNRVTTTATPLAAVPAQAAPEAPARVAATSRKRAAPVLVLVAVHGRCWVQARRDGPTGAVLAERTLGRGESLRLGTGPVWLRLGAPWNVTLRRGAHPLPLPRTTAPLNIRA